MPLDLAVVTADVTARLLRRLPPSLWNTDAGDSTLQRDLMRAIAVQAAIWLENRAIADTMTRLLAAQGVDLDVLLQDYGLKRYLQRPDAYARQIGMNILWTPKGTTYAVRQLADLLFAEQPHVTLRTGPSQVHVFLASSTTVTTPYSYWGLVSQQGVWYAVTVDGDVPLISPMPPPGLNVAPGPHTLAWFTVLDAASAVWYVTIDGDTLQLTQTQPLGYGTSEPFSVLDGQGNVWQLAVDAGSAALVTVLDTGLPGFGYWRLIDRFGTGYDLWIESEVPTIAATPPGGSTDQTPGGVPQAWFQVLDEAGTPWYAAVEDDSLALTRTAPGGSGTTTLPEFLDVVGTRWVLSASSGDAVLVTTAARPYNADLVVLSPGNVFQSLQLLDSAGVVWWLAVEAHVLIAAPTLPTGAHDVTPSGGPYRWLQLRDLAGQTWAVFPHTTGGLVVEATPPGSPGTATPRTLGDAEGVLWHLGVDPAGNIALSETPPVDYGGMATAVCLYDETGRRWFWRVDGSVLEWSTVLWPDTVDQSHWGAFGWLQVPNEGGDARYLAPDTLGAPVALLGPPVTATGGWEEVPSLLDLQGRRWRMEVLVDDDRIGVVPALPEDVPSADTPLALREVDEAVGHVRAAGSLVSIVVI